MIVSENSDKVQEALIHEAEIGMTILKGSKGFGNRGEINDLEIIQTILNRIDSRRVYRIINKVDENAFIQVLLNLIKNSINVLKGKEDGKITISTEEFNENYIKLKINI